MNLQSYWRAVAVATCVVMLGCGRNPPPAPERSAAAAPRTEPVVATAPPGEPSDPSLVSSTVTANLDVNAPWTDSRSEQANAPVGEDTPQAGAPAPDQEQRAVAPVPPPGNGDQGQQAVAPASEPPSPVSSSQAAGAGSTFDVAKTSDDSRTSAN
jgi:hypothetical protein